MKRIFIPLPDAEARKALVMHILKKSAAPNTALPLTERQVDQVVRATNGYSGSDLTALCHEAAMGPIRELSPEQIKTITPDEIRPLHEQVCFINL